VRAAQYGDHFVAAHCTRGDWPFNIAGSITYGLDLDATGHPYRPHEDTPPGAFFLRSARFYSPSVLLCRIDAGRARFVTRDGSLLSKTLWTYARTFVSSVSQLYFLTDGNVGPLTLLEHWRRWIRSRRGSVVSRQVVEIRGRLS
jgi:hypothetical protein